MKVDGECERCFFMYVDVAVAVAAVHLHSIPRHEEYDTHTHPIVRGGAKTEHLIVAISMCTDTENVQREADEQPLFHAL